jgi:uncharacterized membrane protein
MKYPHNLPRYQLHLRHGWPIVLNLFIVVLVEHVLDSVLNFGITPFGLFMDRSVGDPLWEGLCWLAFGITALLYVTGHTHSMFRLTVAIMLIFTFALGMNVLDLVLTLHQRGGFEATYLLADGALIWIDNVLLFTVWYWLLDGGGYLRRCENDWAPRDFLFPPQAVKLPDYPDWHPDYLDYLFLAFCTSTALSPADTATISRRAKALQMLQAWLSLIVIALIVARAINILSSGSS